MNERKVVCGCYNVKEDTIVELINDGINTVEEIGEVTKAGTGCGRCKCGIRKVIDRQTAE